MSVYFIRAGRYFKIGASDNPQRRCARLHQSSTRYTFPADVTTDPAARELYKVVDGWVDLESVIHLMLDDFSVGLEWFLDETPLRQFIDALSERPDPRDLIKVRRDGGWCAAEYDAVQAGRANREVARFYERHQNRCGDANVRPVGRAS